MTRNLLAALVADSLASGCTILLPLAVGRAPSGADAKAKRNAERTATGALILGIALDVAAYALVTTMDEDSGD